jgi:hypothetical protein
MIARDVTIKCLGPDVRSRTKSLIFDLNAPEQINTPVLSSATPCRRCEPDGVELLALD